MIATRNIFEVYDKKKSLRHITVTKKRQTIWLNELVAMNLNYELVAFSANFPRGVDCL